MAWFAGVLSAAGLPSQLLFFMLREPEHASFFGTCEYLVFPTMLTAPVFQPHVWRRGLFSNYAHTFRALIQANRHMSHPSRPASWLLFIGIIAFPQRCHLTVKVYCLVESHRTCYLSDL